MNKRLKRTTANLPADLLKDAMESTGLGITETLIEGLKLVKRSRAFEMSQKLRGKVSFEFNVDQSRERSSN